MKASMTVSGGGRSQSQSANGSGDFSVRGKTTVLTSKDGIVNEIKIHDITGIGKGKASAEDQTETMEWKSPLGGVVANGKKEDDEWSFSREDGKELDYLQKKNLQQIVMVLLSEESAKILFPEEKVAGKHKWAITKKKIADYLSSQAENLPDIDGGNIQEGFEEISESIDIKVDMLFRGLRDFGGHQCAVIGVKITGRIEPPKEMTEAGVKGKFTIRGSGEIVRSLKTYRNLSGNIDLRLSGNASGSERGMSMRLKAGGRLKASWSEKNILPPAQKPPKTTDPEVKPEGGPDEDSKEDEKTPEPEAKPNA